MCNQGSRRCDGTEHAQVYFASHSATEECFSRSTAPACAAGYQRGIERFFNSEILKSGRPCYCPTVSQGYIRTLIPDWLW